MIRAGEMKYFLDFYELSGTTDQYGAISKNWIKITDCRAKINYKSGDKIVDDLKNYNKDFLNIIVWKNSLIKEQMRVKILGNNSLYVIKNINPFNEEGKALFITLEKINESL